MSQAWWAQYSKALLLSSVTFDTKLKSCSSQANHLRRAGQTQAIQPGLNTLLLLYVSILMERASLEKRKKNPNRTWIIQILTGQLSSPRGFTENVLKHNLQWALLVALDWSYSCGLKKIEVGGYNSWTKLGQVKGGGRRKMDNRHLGRWKVLTLKLLL